MTTDALWLRFLPGFVRTRIEGRVNLQRVLSNTGWLVIDKIIRMGIALFVGIWIARYLGPEQFGLLNYATAFVFLFSPLATLGLDQIVVRNIVRNPLEKNETLGTVFVLKLIGAIFVLALTTVVIFLRRPGDNLTHSLIIIIAVGTLFQSFDVIDLWFQSQVQTKYVVWVRCIVLLIMAIVKIILILLQMPVLAFALAYTAELLVSATGLAIVYQLKEQPLRFWKATVDRAKNLLKDSWLVILSSVAIIIYMKIDQIMLGDMIGEKAVGIYSAAVRVSELWYFVPTAIVTSIFPSIVATKQVDEILYYQRIQKLFDLMTALSCIIMVGVILFSEQIIAILYGDAYQASVSVLFVHVWATILVFWGTAQSYWEINEGLMHLMFWKTLAGAVLNIILNLALIPTYGALGAAFATFISYALAGPVLNVIVSSKTRRLFLVEIKSFLFFRSLWSIK